MSGRERLVNWLKFYKQSKPPTPKQKERYEIHSEGNGRF